MTQLNHSLTTTAPDGTLTSTTNLYLSSAESFPLVFQVSGNTVPITVNFSIAANDPTIPAGSPLPTLTPQQCQFAATNPAPCTLSVKLGNAPVGQYKVIPSVVGAAEFSTAVVMNFQNQTQFTLPLGTYKEVGQLVSRNGTGCLISDVPNQVLVDSFLINTATGVYKGGRLSDGSEICGQVSNSRKETVNLPSYSSADFTPAGQFFYTNASWNGSVFVTTDITYPGCIETITYTFVSSSTISSACGL